MCLSRWKSQGVVSAAQVAVACNSCSLGEEIRCPSLVPCRGVSMPFSGGDDIVRGGPQRRETLLVALADDAQGVVALNLRHLVPVRDAAHCAVDVDDEGPQVVELDAVAVDGESCRAARGGWLGEREGLLVCAGGGILATVVVVGGVTAVRGGRHGS